MQRMLFRLYFSAVVVIGFPILFWSLWTDLPFRGDHLWVPIAAMAIGYFLGELFPVLLGTERRGTTVTFASGVGLTLTVVAPLAVVLIAHTAAVIVYDVYQRRAPSRTVFNVAQNAIGSGACSLTFSLLAGHQYLLGDTLSMRDLVALIAAGLVYLVVNWTLVGVVTGLSIGRLSLAHIAGDGWEVRVLTYLVDLALAPLCLATIHYAPILLPFTVVPTLVIWASARLAAQREHAALHDVLTGLPNRAYLRNTFEDMLGEVEQEDAELAVMLIDLDHFKDINDTLGHHVGDLLLIEVASRLTSVMRSGDVVARLGGDEFAVLASMPCGQARAQGSELAERLVRVLDSPFHAENVRIDVRGSVGVAMSPEHGMTMETLMSRADIALYQAKEARGCWAAYDPDTDQRAPEHLSLLGQLREGIDTGQLEVYYQPKVELRTGKVVGVEALVRWRHPEQGVLLPDAFIPIAEGTGLIIPLTLQVLDQALRCSRQWLDRGWLLNIAVNLSVRHLTDDHLPAQVAEVLARHAVPAELLTLEVTEGTVMSDPLQAAAVLRGLRALGLRISLDDYGVGYCSLAYLCRLEVDELKIDRSLVANLALSVGGSASDALVVRSTIALAHDLGLRVVAEGVEDLESLTRLTDMQCDVAQGYYFSRPLPAGTLEDWLATQDVAGSDLAGSRAP